MKLMPSCLAGETRRDIRPVSLLQVVCNHGCRSTTVPAVQIPSFSLGWNDLSCHVSVSLFA